ncbi:MAG: NHLP bacteriocin export ABC transporter permease/ATPase subunit [Elainellaceae cyanobacterium]
MDVQQIQGNEPLLLDDPTQPWIVQSGCLGVFAIRVQHGIPQGQHRHLFNVYPGEAIFGTALHDREQLGMVAIALEPTEVRSLSIDEALGNRREQATRTEVNSNNPNSGSTLSSALDSLAPSSSLYNHRALLDGWIHKLGQVNGFPSAPIHSMTPQRQYLSLMAGQVCEPPRDQVLWVRLQYGQARWVGDSSAVLTPEIGHFPLGNDMWIEADDYVELESRSTSEISDRSILLNGLMQLHAYFLTCVERLEAQELEAAQRRFQERQQLNQEVTRQTLQQLVSLLQPQGDRMLYAESPLLVAAGAVGRAMGVTIQPPMKSENLKHVKEPLEAIARASRLRMRQILLRGNWWKKDGGPILAYTQQDRYPVALLPVKGNRYELLNPIEAGLVGVPDFTGSPRKGRIFVDERAAATIDPVAYVFYRPLPDGKLNAIDILKFALQGRMRDAIVLVLTGVAATLLGMLVPQATAILIDNAIPYGNGGLVVQIGLGLLAAAFGGTCFQLAQAIASMRIETASDASLQAAVWDRLLKLRTSFFREYSIGDLTSRVSGITSIRQRLSGTALQTIFSGSFALINLGLLFYYSPRLAALALVVAVIVITFTTASGVALIRKHRPLMEIEGKIYGLLVQLMNGVPKLRIAGAEERAFAHWGQHYIQQLQLTLSTQRLEDGVNVFNTIMPTLTTIALFWLASTLINPEQVISGSGLTAGDFLAFNVAFGTFIGGATSLSLTLIEVLDIIPLWQRSQPILDAQPEVDLTKADPGRLSGNIHIDHLTFRYRDDGRLILDDVTIRANPGEFIALVGPSGSGKSTMIRLLLGFETPMSGTVYYDGQDLAGLDVSAVRRQLGVVLQNGRISAGTIFENISSGALITLDDAWDAAEMAGLADDVRAMPMQLHTLISEGGSNLSGGQRQRLIIARALALKPRILLLDEATSALDNRTQAIVSQSLDRLNVTRVVIAHRLSTIRNADRIYVLESGRVVQQGTFNELARQDGVFAQLIKRQVA